MTKTKRRTLLIIGAALLLTLAAVLCVFLLRPKTTIASLMELDSPDQIEKIELAEFRFGLDSPDPNALSFQKADITGAELGKQYQDAIFSMEVSEYEREQCITSSDIVGRTPDFWAVMLTVKSSDTASSGSKIYYLPVEMMRGMSDGSKIDSYALMYTKNGNEISNEHFFSLPDNKLFTKDFIRNQVSVVKTS